MLRVYLRESNAFSTYYFLYVATCISVECIWYKSSTSLAKDYLNKHLIINYSLSIYTTCGISRTNVTLAY